MNIAKLVLSSLAVLSSLFCTVLLFRAYARRHIRLLMWSTICFIGLTVNNMVLFLDLIVFPDVDLRLFRLVPALIGMLCLFVRLHLGCRLAAAMVQLLSGALILAYAAAAIHFLKFWRRTEDRLFLHFAIAFCLFALNQLASSVPAVTDETAGYEYLLRVIGFVVILIAIADKNLSPPRVGPE